MKFNLDVTEGQWFPFFTSHLDLDTGEIVYDEPVSDARVQIRSIAPFIEERLAKRKRVKEHVYNPKSRSMEMVTYFSEPSVEEALAEREDMWDYAIVSLENFKDSKTGEIIACTRENKIKLMKVPVFDRFIARCLQMMANSGVAEEKRKN